MKKSSNLIAAVGVVLIAAVAVYFNEKNQSREESPSTSGKPPENKIASKGAIGWAPLGLKEAGQLVIEMYKVVFEIPLKDQKLILQYADALVQGASLEGIYNGLAHSGFYRELEKKNPGPASTQALRYFAQELFLIESALPEKTYFTEKHAQLLSRAMGYEELERAAMSTTPLAEPSHRAQSAADFEQIFKNASYFTLKRVLCDELLKQIAILSSSKEALATWYDRFSVRHAGFKVDFGIELRNRADESFHKDWALLAPTDRLTWEVLNRVHRVLDSMSKK